MPLADRITSLANAIAADVKDLRAVKHTRGVMLPFNHEASPANPPAGQLSVFAKNDNRMYRRNSVGEEVELGANPNVFSTGTTATLTPDAKGGVWAVLSLDVNITIANPTGTPQDAQEIIIRIRDNGTSRSIAWGTAWRPIGAALPTATTATKVNYIIARWHPTFVHTHNVWDVIQVNKQA